MKAANAALDKLAQDVSQILGDRLARKIPIEHELWDGEQMAEYLKVSKRQVLERYAAQPGFPRAIRLPSDNGNGQRRWKAKEIIAWAEGLIE
jgi:predicted DNA-binding transcriptional regulator AlpA